VIGLVLGAPGFLAILISYATGLCSELFGRTLSCGYTADYETLSIGVVLFLAGLSEFAVAFKRKRDGELFWESDVQRTMRKTGITAMLIGTVISFATFFKVENEPMLAPWDLNGIYGILFYSGLVLVGLGVGLITGSRFLKIKPVKAAADRVLVIR
jgi:uncharacterized membrane protein